MIQGFRDSDAEAIFNEQGSRRLGACQQVAFRRLLMLNAAEALCDLRIPPGNRLEALKGWRKGQHSIRINDQWRICFEWPKGAPGPENPRGPGDPKT